MPTHQRAPEPAEDTIRMPLTIAVPLLLVAIWLGVHITHNVTDALRAITASSQYASLPQNPPAR